MSIFEKKLILGTVQFGLEYGVGKERKLVEKKNAEEIIFLSQRYGITKIDTAVNYGDVENFIGSLNLKNFEIISKLPNFQSIDNPKKWVTNNVFEIIKRLKRKQIDILLLHNPRNLLAKNGDQIYENLLFLKEKKIIKKIGISLHFFNDLKKILDKFSFDIIQLPFSIFDQRLLHHNRLRYLINKKIEIHVRSIFLQGILLMDKIDRPTYLNQWDHLFKAWENWLSENQITKLEACINFIKSFDIINGVLLGFKSTQQLEELFKVKDYKNLMYPKRLSCNDLNLIDPSRWIL